MAVKITRSVVSEQIPRLVNQIAFLSSISCANNSDIYPHNNHNTPCPSDFEAKIQFLRNKLVPDRLIRVLDSTSDLDSALKIFKWAGLQRQFRHTADTYHPIILRLALAGNIVEMENFCQNMVRDRCAGAKEALVSLINLFVRFRRLDEAIRLLIVMNSNGYRPLVDIFNVVLAGLVEEKRSFPEVLFVYKEMVKAGVRPSIDTLNHLLEALFVADRVDSAMDQYRRLNKKRCTPNSRTFEIILKGLVVNYRVDEAVSFFDEMFRVNIKPDLGFYKNTIHLFCRENRLEVGMKLYKMMKASGFVPDFSIYRALIKCLCKNLYLSDANKLLEEMMESGISADDDVFVDIVKAYCQMGKISEALELLEDKHVLGTSPYNAFLEGCCSAGKFVVAKGVLERMSERNIADHDSWNIIIRSFCKNIGIAKAYQLLGKMIVCSLVPDQGTYSALVVGNCKLGRFDDAYELFHQVSAKCWILDDRSYSELIEGLCRVEKVTEAVKLFCYMSTNGCCLQSSSFNTLIKGLCDMGRLDEAIKLRLIASNAGISCTNSTYATIMLGLAKTGNAKDLLVLLSQLLVEGHVLDLETYCIILQTMSTQNQSSSCAFFLMMMVDKGYVPDPGTLFDVLLCLTNNSQLHLILSAIDKLVSDNDILNSSTYNLLVTGLWKEGKKSEACHLLDLMLGKGWVPDATTHRLLIGSATGKETNRGKWPSQSSMEDNINNILVEGLGNL